MCVFFGGGVVYHVSGLFGEIPVNKKLKCRESVIV